MTHPTRRTFLHLNSFCLGTYLFLCTFAAIRTVLTLDLCSTTFDADTVASNVKTSVAPRGGANAGNFWKDPVASDFVECLDSCCNRDSCNVAFFFKDVCFLITCNTTYPEGCEPEPRQEPQFKDSYWVTLRPIERVDRNASPKPFRTDHRLVDEGCDTDRDCDADGGEECQIISAAFPAERRCECTEGLVRDSDTHRCMSSPVGHGGGGGVGRSCTVGLVDNCFPGEVCLPKNSRSRSGLCVCETGYSRQPQDAAAAVCLPDAVENTASTHIPDAKSLKSLTTTTSTSTSRTSLLSSKTRTSTAASTKSTTASPASVANRPPIAVAMPSNQIVQLPQELKIDGSSSTDDTKIVRYSWEIVSKPMEYHREVKARDATQPILHLKDLSPGFYRFRLTVMDGEGLQSSTFANATIMKETDNPPVANAGQDVVVDRPETTAMLYGNASHDDKGIVDYKWTMKSRDSHAVDMEGVLTPILKLTNLEVGVYTFSLQVTDAAGQTSTAEVHVLVRPEQNQPPVAVAGPNQTLSVPVDIVTLDGSGSSDDQGIESYLWTVVSGPSSVVITNPHSSVTTVSKLITGQYTFQLTVRDKAGLEANSIKIVTVKDGQNKAPAANAGGNVVVTLPVNFVRLNGSMSSDDVAVVSYTWTRDQSSPAAGEVLSNTDHESVLELVGVVSGRYVFSLEVKDAEGLTSHDSASVIVRPDPLELNLVGLHLIADVSSFSQLDKMTLAEKLSLLLGKVNASGTTQVFIRNLASDVTSGLTLVTIYVETVISDEHITWPGPEVITALTKVIPASREILDFQISQFDTVVCQNNCSGHGHCDTRTRLCVCGGFWMEDFVKARFGQRQRNCDWSILYVVLVIVFAVILTCAMLCAFIWVCKRCAYCRPKLKRHRYMLLEERLDDEDGDLKTHENVRLLEKGRIQSSSLMESESDFSSEETIFVNNKRPANGSAGKVANGSAARKSKVKA